jgi:hypothetical protein
MRIKTVSALFAGLVLWAAPSLLGQLSSAQSWNLPQGTTVKDSGPRTYRFIVDYNTANTKGEMVFRQRLTGEYTRGLAGGEVMWKNVTEAEATGATAPFAAAQKRDFMEGFRYHNDIGSTMKPEFFQGISSHGCL